MGLLNKIKQLADDATKTASDLSDKAMTASAGISKKASLIVGDISDKTSVLTGDISKKASAIADDVSKKADDAWQDVSKGASKAFDEVRASATDVKKWAETAPNTIGQYAKDFNADEMWKKIQEWGAKAGQDLLIMVLSLYYTIKNFIPELNDKKKKEK